MIIDHMKNLWVTALVGLLALFLAFCIFLSLEIVPGHKELECYLLTKKLTKIEPLLAGSGASSSKTNAVVYVLGGPQTTLDSKFKTAAELYHQGLAKRILLLSVPGITEYDHQLRRNLTNDEWSINKLIEKGVNIEDIEPINLIKGCFGTLTEAKGISDIAYERGYKRLILVTNSFHSMRTWLSFSKFVKDRGISLFLYAAPDHTSLYRLLSEYCKLILYKNYVLTFLSSSSLMSPHEASSAACYRDIR